jgi:hypothetical protein
MSLNIKCELEEWLKLWSWYEGGPVFKSQYHQKQVGGGRP